MICNTTKFIIILCLPNYPSQRRLHTKINGKTLFYFHKHLFKKQRNKNLTQVHIFYLYLHILNNY